MDILSFGFTGTRRGMTLPQRRSVREFLELMRPTELHHGQCVGADFDAHLICLELGIPVILHPGSLPALTAECAGARESHPPKAMLARNEDIVRASELLIAVPFRVNEVLRSGTWAAVRRARKLGRRIVLVHPCGGLRSGA